MEHLKGKYDKLIFILTICSVILLFFSRLDFWLNWFSISSAVFLGIVVWVGDCASGKPMFIVVTLYSSKYILWFLVYVLRDYAFYTDFYKLEIAFGLIFYIVLLLLYWRLIHINSQKKNLTITIMILFGVNILYSFKSISDRSLSEYGTILFLAVNILILCSYYYNENEEGFIVGDKVKEKLKADNMSINNNYERVPQPYFSEAQTPQPQQFNHYEKIPHPYHQLGGWLKFFVWSIPIALVLQVLSEGLQQWIMRRELEVLMEEEFLIEMEPSFFEMISFIIVGVFVFLMISQVVMKIRKKDPIFLKNFVQIEVIYHLIFIILFIFFRHKFANKDIRGFFSSIILVIVWFKYFTKSVRVRTYMGSDEYLRLCPLSKNTPSPIPADIKREF